MGWWAAISSIGLAAGLVAGMLRMNLAGVDGPQVAPLRLRGRRPAALVILLCNHRSLR
jgi:hypothetical protein